MEDKRDRIDELIDAGLERYAGVEPPLGLESRVVARLRDRQTQPTAWRRGFWLALATAAALAVVVIGLQVARWPQPTPKETPPERATSVAAHAQPPMSAPPQVAIKVPPPVRPRHLHPAVVQARELAPRQEQFPAPAAPSAQERLLAQVARPPILLALANPEPEPVAISPVEVKPVEIRPLPDPTPELK